MTGNDINNSDAVSAKDKEEEAALAEQILQGKTDGSGDVEILAPAGSRQSLEAAVFCGANAVYLGMPRFGARAYAENFDPQELCSAVSFAHGYGAKIYVTLNTLLYNEELHAAAESLSQVCAAGADGIIVQDMAMLRLAAEAAPDMPLHASTQMSIHSLEGALMLAELGVKRVVLARELTFRQIEYITAGCRERGVETEVFVHGALCFSASGQCYLSGALGGSGRCGNRGSCAQPCRLPFSAQAGPKEKYALSLKDMSYMEHLDKLKNAGVASLKIEGRMKRPEYVAAAVTAARDSLMGKKPDMQLLADVFSRSGFTDGYLTGIIGEKMFGVRRKEDVAASAGALKQIKALYSKPTQLVPVDAAFCMRPDMPVTFEIGDGERVVRVEGEIPDTAKTRSTTSADIEPLLRRLGGTPFYVQNMAVVISEGLNIPIAVVNDMRRSAAAKLLELRSSVQSVPYAPDKAADTINSVKAGASAADAEKKQIWARFESAAQLFDGAGARFSRIILPAEEILSVSAIGQWDNIAAEMPRIAADFEYDLNRTLEKLSEIGVKYVLADGIGVVRAAKRYGFEVIGGMGLNVVNSIAEKEYRKLGVTKLILSHETPLADIRRMDAGMVIYGHMPLTISKNCPIRSQISCKGKGCPLMLTDRMGKQFPVICGKKRGGYTKMLNPEPIYLADKNPAAKIWLLYFTVEDSLRCKTVTAMAEQRMSFDGKFTRAGQQKAKKQNNRGSRRQEDR
ncbi:MAG: U32 family peptidase [Ruminococcaceae bacterium]|nr:U32 family peptidase [Oscillospiraceae bacterium]